MMLLRIVLMKVDVYTAQAKVRQTVVSETTRMVWLDSSRKCHSLEVQSE